MLSEYMCERECNASITEDLITGKGTTCVLWESSSNKLCQTYTRMMFARKNNTYFSLFSEKDEKD